MGEPDERELRPVQDAGHFLQNTHGAVVAGHILRRTAQP